MKTTLSLVTAMFMLSQLSCSSSEGVSAQPTADQPSITDTTDTTDSTDSTDTSDALGATDSTNTTELTDTTELTAGWTVLEANYPRMRGEYDMAYDLANQRIIAFGGRTGFRSDFEVVDETWSFDYSTANWTDRQPANSPAWRTSHTMIYDPVRNKTLLFGGNDFGQVFNDLWEYDYQLNTWTDLAPSNPPEARQMHGMTYVPGHDVFVLFGGRRLNGGAAFNDIWAYDYSLNAWEQLEPASSPPRQDHVNIASYDSEAQVILYVGAESETAPATWAYDLDTNSWSALDSADTPDATHSSLTYDSDQERLVLFGSSPSEDAMRTWTYDYSDNSWSEVTPESMPDTYIEHDAMVYLSDYNVFIQYGGCCTDNTMELVMSQ